MELGLHQARSLGDPLIVRSALALIRRLIPERWRARLHPFPSLRQSVLYADVWDEIPGGPVLVWTRDPAGARLLALGASEQARVGCVLGARIPTTFTTILFLVGAC